MADLVITTTNIIAAAGARTATGELGEDSMTAGMAVYRDSTDNNRLKKADAGDSAKAEAVGILLNGGDTGQPCTYIQDGTLGFGAILTVGERYYVSNTAGGIYPATDLDADTGAYVTMLGVATSTSNMLLNLLASGAQIT